MDERKHIILQTKEWTPRNVEAGTLANRIVFVVWFNQDGNASEFSSHRQIQDEFTGELFLDGGHYETCFGRAYKEFQERV